MNLSASRQEVITALSTPVQPKVGVAAATIIVAMGIYALIAYSGVGAGVSLPLSLSLAVATYGLTVFLYFGIARLAFERHTHVLWGAAVGAVVLSYLVSGLSILWPVLAGWSSLLFAAVIAGRKTMAGSRQKFVYISAAVSVAFFASVQYLPLWSELSQMVESSGNELLTNLTSQLSTAGYSDQAIRDNAEQTGKMLKAFVRLVPAATVLGALMQFSIGYLIFVRWARGKQGAPTSPISFTELRVPFSLAPVLIVCISIRLVFDDPAALAADNMLAILSVYYCVGGLSLLEYYLKRLSIARAMKVLFYVFLFFTQLVGFFVAILIGFVDSFFDWRNRPPRLEAGNA